MNCQYWTKEIYVLCFNIMDWKWRKCMYMYTNMQLENLKSYYQEKSIRVLEKVSDYNEWTLQHPGNAASFKLKIKDDMKRIFPKWHPWTRNKCSQQKHCTLIFVLSRICYKMSLHLCVSHWSSVCSLFLSEAVPSEATLGDTMRAGWSHLPHLVAIAVKNAFSSRWFWSLINLWLVLRTNLCILLGKLLLCCGWSSLLFHGGLLCDLFAVGTGQTDSPKFDPYCATSWHLSKAL